MNVDPQQPNNVDPQQSGKVTPSNPAPGPGSPPPSNPAPAPPPAATDWTSDPIYQLVVGQQNLAIKQAQSAALTAQTQALIAYGDPTLALAVTGDQNVAAAAAANKGSTLAQLVASNAQTVRGTNETENQSNLFYSSDRGYKLGLDQQMYLNNTSQALSSLQGNLGNIASNLLAQEQSAYQQEQQAASDAYNRAISNPVGSPPPATSGGSGAGSGGGSSGGEGSSSSGGVTTQTTTQDTAGGTTPGAKTIPPGALARIVASATAAGQPISEHGAGQMTQVLTPAQAQAAKAATAPKAVKVKANPTGGSANKTQGVFSTH